MNMKKLYIILSLFLSLSMGQNYGCTDSTACNFNTDASIFDNSCGYDGCTGCTNPDAMNYDQTAIFDSGGCYSFSDYH